MLFLISGCTSKYTLTYEDDKFSEELIISNISLFFSTELFSISKQLNKSFKEISLSS